MKASSFSARGLYPVLIGLSLLRLAASIYIDPVTDTKTYPHVRVSFEYWDLDNRERVEEPRYPREVLVPLTNYREYKTINPPVADPLLSRYFGTIQADEPHVLVAMSGRAKVDAKIAQILSIDGPDGAQKVVCLTKAGNKYVDLTSLPPNKVVDEFECLALFLNADFSNQFKGWLSIGSSYVS